MEGLSHIINVAKNFKGLKRKVEIGEITKILGEHEYDDAGVIEFGGLNIVVSTDGITEDLVKSDPWFAGYYSVLVNVNDVVVKGARPMGYVNVMSGTLETRRRMAEGIKAGLDKYGLKLLKGHTHPDSSYEAIDAAVVGIAKKVAKGSTARPGDLIVMALDLDGSFGVKGWVRCFDSTLRKTGTELRVMLESIVSAIEYGLVRASRDISAPGVLGSLAMLCEASSVGAEVDAGRIPRPAGTNISDWFISYPAMGFIFATDDGSLVEKLNRAGFSASVVGKFDDTKKIKVRLGSECRLFMDLSFESVFGIR
ncbi:MAG: AIR synthase related protein [Candidatus Verstraetearchaeota archaeon]|nr:AIR synthase related protein [Candidatus Verstraetearchaeota archaeon]